MDGHSDERMGIRFLGALALAFALVVFIDPGGSIVISEELEQIAYEIRIEGEFSYTAIGCENPFDVPLPCTLPIDERSQISARMDGAPQFGSSSGLSYFAALRDPTDPDSWLCLGSFALKDDTYVLNESREEDLRSWQEFRIGVGRTCENFGGSFYRARFSDTDPQMQHASLTNGRFFRLGEPQDEETAHVWLHLMQRDGGISAGLAFESWARFLISQETDLCPWLIPHSTSGTPVLVPGVCVRDAITRIVDYRDWAEGFVPGHHLGEFSGVVLSIEATGDPTPTRTAPSGVVLYRADFEQ